MQKQEERYSHGKLLSAEVSGWKVRIISRYCQHYRIKQYEALYIYRAFCRWRKYCLEPTHQSFATEICVGFITGYFADDAVGKMSEVATALFGSGSKTVSSSKADASSGEK